MKKFLLSLVALFAAFAVNAAAPYTWTKVAIATSGEAFDLDDPDFKGVELELETPDLGQYQMYVQFGMCLDMLGYTLYEEDATEGVKKTGISWTHGSKAIAINPEDLDYGKTYRMVIPVGALNMISYMDMSTVVENTEEITLTFSTKAARTEPFVKSAKLNVSKYDKIDLDDDSFAGITLTVVTRNLPTAGSYNVFNGAARLKDLNAGTSESCVVSYKAVSVNDTTVITLVTPDKMKKGGAYQIELFKEGLYVSNMFNPIADPYCYVAEQTIEFYTKYEEPVENSDFTIDCNETGFTLMSEDPNEKFTVSVFDESYLGGKTPEQYAFGLLEYQNESNISTGEYSSTYAAEYMTWFENSTYYIVATPAAYDDIQEACYAIKKPYIFVVYMDKDVFKGSEDITTAIKSIKSLNTDDIEYNIGGVRAKGSHGVVIKNGKKYIK